MRNHLGTYECKLCLTLHNTEVLQNTLSLVEVKSVHAFTCTFVFHRVVILCILRARNTSRICKLVEKVSFCEGRRC